MIDVVHVQPKAVACNSNIHCKYTYFMNATLYEDVHIDSNLLFKRYI